MSGQSARGPASKVEFRSVLYLENNSRIGGETLHELMMMDAQKWINLRLEALAKIAKIVVFDEDQVSYKTILIRAAWTKNMICKNVMIFPPINGAMLFMKRAGTPFVSWSQQAAPSMNDVIIFDLTHKHDECFQNVGIEPCTIKT